MVRLQWWRRLLLRVSLLALPSRTFCQINILHLIHRKPPPECNSSAAYGHVSVKPWSFTVLGVQKGGTTSLAHHIQSHPDLCTQQEARVIYDRHANTTHYNWGVHSLHGTWCGSDCPKHIGVVDPMGAFFFSRLPASERAFIGDAYRQHAPMKLVLLLREPIQRAFSGYMMGLERNFRYGFRHSSFDQLVETELPWMTNASDAPQSMGFWGRETLRQGLYGEQLQALEESGFKYPGSRLFILISERVQANPTREHERLWEYLGARRLANTTSQFDRTRTTHLNSTISEFAATALHRAYRKSTAHVYAVMEEAVAEWEEWYRLRGLQ